MFAAQDGSNKGKIVQLLYAQMPVQMEPALSQILVHVMLVFMDRYVTGNVLLISGDLTADMIVNARMEPNVITILGHAPALLDGKGSSVKSHVIRASLVTSVNTSVYV